jgi:hypothetical protein
VFRNQLVQKTALLSKKEFRDLSISFECKNNPITGKPIKLTFDYNDFVQVSHSEATGLFKQCAMDLPQPLTTD